MKDMKPLNFNWAQPASNKENGEKLRHIYFQDDKEVLAIKISNDKCKITFSGEVELDLEKLEKLQKNLEEIRWEIIQNTCTDDPLNYMLKHKGIKW